MIYIYIGYRIENPAQFREENKDIHGVDFLLTALLLYMQLCACNISMHISKLASKNAVLIHDN